MFLASNLKFLRARKRQTQAEVCENAGIKNINNYENGYAEPPIEILKKLSDYYNISIDNLIGFDLNSLTEHQFIELERGTDVYSKGSSLRVIVTSVDRDNNDNIEMVPVKSVAGYTTGFADREFIRSLPVFQLPFVSKSKKYRLFPITGNSMLIPDKSFVLGEYVQDFNDIKDGKPYIVVTKNDGLVFKMIERKNKKLVLSSLNPEYEPYEVYLNEVLEIWKFTFHISPELPEESLPKEVIASVMKIHSELKKLKK